MNFLNNMDLLQHTIKSLNNANRNISKISDFTKSIEGMSSHKIRHLINNLCNITGIKYLEVGSYTGSTFCSAVDSNKGEFTSIDYWPNPVEFKETRDKFMENLLLCQRELTLERKIKLIDEDCFKYDKKDLKDINVYLYDGDHSRKSQKDGLTYYNDVLADEFILMVDDWNSNDVYQGTCDAFRELNWTIKYHWILPGYVRDWKMNDELWWNGFAVFVIQKNK